MEPDRGEGRTFDLQDGASLWQRAPGHSVCKDAHPLELWNASDSSWRLVRTGLFLSNCWEMRTVEGRKKGKQERKIKRRGDGTTGSSREGARTKSEMLTDRSAPHRNHTHVPWTESPPCKWKRWNERAFDRDFVKKMGCRWSKCKVTERDPTTKATLCS